MATKKKPALPPPPNVEISPPVVMDDTWSFHVNGERVTMQQWRQTNADHAAWVAEQERANADPHDVPKKRAKKTK